MQFQEYSRDMLLSALQAIVIYVLVQVLDPASIAHNNVVGLIMTVGVSESCIS